MEKIESLSDVLKAKKKGRPHLEMTVYFIDGNMPNIIKQFGSQV